MMLFGSSMACLLIKYKLGMFGEWLCYERNKTFQDMVS